MKNEHLKKLVRSQIQNAKAWLPPFGRKPFIKLDLNEGYHVLSSQIIEKLRNFDPFIISSYPEYDTLLGKLSKYTGVPVDHLCLTNGSDHGIQMVCSLFVQEGDKVVIPSPTFFPYFSLLGIQGADIINVYYKDNGGVYEFPFIETLEALTDETKALMLCNPNNPLGCSSPIKQIEALVKRAHELSIPVIIDEAYFEFGESTSVSLMDKYDNIVVLRTFSKAFGLAGLRIGYIIAQPSICAELIKLKLAWTVNHFSVFAAEVVLDHTPYFFDKIKELKIIKHELCRILTNYGCSCYSTDTNFIIIKIDNNEDLIKKMKDAGILVSDVSHYPFSNGLLENGVRISIPSRDDLEKIQSLLQHPTSK